MIIEKGPIGTPFLFNYENRNNPKIVIINKIYNIHLWKIIYKIFILLFFFFFFLIKLKELGQLILNVVNVIPDGIVIFFPSYLYLNEVYEFWDKNNYLKQIENKKKVNINIILFDLIFIYNSNKIRNKYVLF